MTDSGRQRGALWGGWVLAAVLLAAWVPAHAAQVRQFMPQGRVDQQTRATARFDADVVRLGDTSAAAPLLADCGAVRGEGRWIDARTWAWQLERPLQAGERCSLRPDPAFRDLQGAALGGNTRFEFFAAGPWPRSVYPRSGNAIDEEQVFVINAGGPLKAASVEQLVWCEADGVGQRIPVRQMSPADRQAVLVHAGRHAGMNLGPDPLVLQCSQRLPAGAKMRLVWGKGIESANGQARSEKEESFSYTVRPAFRATLSCERENASAPCSPLSSVRVEFGGAHVELAALRKARLVTPDGTRSPKDPAKDSNERPDTADSITFPGPLPQDAELRLELPAGLKDDAGRTLANAERFPLKFRTGRLPPLAKFPGAFGIVELNEGALLPVTLRNVEAPLAGRELHLPGTHGLTDLQLTDDAAVIATMQALAKFERQTREVTLTRDGETLQVTDPHYARELSFLARRGGVARMEIPKPGGSAEFEVVGIPLGKPGYHVVEIESRLLGAALLSSPKPMYVRAAALVTNMAVHLKRGRDNALVWVTTLDKAQPVAQAEVRVSGCDGRELWRGRTDAQGRASIDQALPVPNCRADEGGFLFASARHGEDYSFVRSDWNEGLEPWRFGVQTWGESERLKIHSVLDRTLLRPGQTVSMKHIARRRDSRGFALPAAAELPSQLVIRHGESGAEFSQPLSWAANGSALSSWTIPAAAKRGDYEITFSSRNAGGTLTQLSSSQQFRVGDFRLPVYTGSVSGVPARQVAPSKVPLALGLSFLNGGAAKGAEVKVSATLRPRWPVYPHYENFNFNIDFNDDALNAFGITPDREREHLVLDAQALKLDQAGAAKLDVALPQPPRGPSELYAEMSFTDPNGEVQTLHGTVELWAAQLALGMQISDWASNRGDQQRVSLVVLNTAGQPVAGQEVTLQAKREINYSHRRRIVGGFYAFEHQREYTDLGEVCRGRTDSRGLLLCELKGADQPGQIHLLAQTRDAQGRSARASGSFWVSGAGGDLWFSAGNQDRIDVIPERRAYQPGETARLQVRTPFLEATALVAIEAGGIIETFVRPLARFDPVIELPVKAEWGPNVYVSVLAVRGRVEPLRWTSFFRWGWREPMAWFKAWWNPLQPTAMVDLAKPSFRLGLGELQVGSKGFELKVELQPERADYRPRDNAKLRIKATLPDGRPAAGAEVAFAGVDQALLELKPNESWNLLDALLTKRAYEVETATAQSQVIGKRHFGKKAVPAGGGGGRGPARELFDTLLLWQPRVLLDAQGQANLSVPINDSLTEFRLVGVATSGAGLFGTGSASIRTRQDLQLIAGLPPLVREKDRYQALLTLRNGTARAMTVQVGAKAGDKALAPQQVRLEPEGAAELSWPAEVPEGLASQVWEFDASEATAQGGNARDRLKITQQVVPAVPVTVQQATFTRIDGRVDMPALPPAGALPGKGGIELSLSSKLSTPPSGLRRYLEAYPFSCLEQRTSVAVGLNDPKRWDALVGDLPALLDANGLARYFPGDGPGSVALSAHLLDMAALSGFALPDETRTRLIQGLTGFVEGRFKTESWSPAGSGAQLELRLAALEALTRQGAKPTRAAAALEVEPLRLPTAALLDWWLVLRRLPELPQQAALAKAAEQEVRNRLTYTGGRLGFTTERSDYWWWVMVSGDSNAFRLVEAVLDQPGWKDELPRLLQGAIERQVRGHWFTTTANAWAALTLAQFGRRFEREPVTGLTRASLGAARAELRWKTADLETPPAPLSLPWPGGSSVAASGNSVGSASGSGGAARGGGNVGSSSGATLSLVHEGSGKPWAAVQVLAAIPGGAPRAFGYRVTRSVQPLQSKVAGQTSRGDLWRVTLDIEAEQDMTWVVLSDPIPAGARILGDGDGRDSRIATLDEDQRNRRVWPIFVERTFGAFNAYYEVVPRGRFRIDYTVRLNNAGEFSLPPTRVEAMYAPDVFGEVPNAAVVVKP